MIAHISRGDSEMGGGVELRQCLWRTEIHNISAEQHSRSSVWKRAIHDHSTEEEETITGDNLIVEKRQARKLASAL